MQFRYILRLDLKPPSIQPFDWTSVLPTWLQSKAMTCWPHMPPVRKPFRFTKRASCKAYFDLDKHAACKAYFDLDKFTACMLASFGQVLMGQSNHLYASFKSTCTKGILHTLLHTSFV